ncbi:MAG: hypothetical protein UU89_C0031G0008 [Parcubacteria group bacterium GW2011_GWC2_42_11]|nr:MAG: hypothetical protein UU89_C0031G0008 [Parcubacteria group bacterium GW2011_GWC2_42_11]
MKNIVLFALLLIILGGIVWQYQENNNVVPEEVPEPIVTKENNTIPEKVSDTITPEENENVSTPLAYKDVIVVRNLNAGGITSPLIIEGEARGTWYFEASFPVVLTNWDGLIIAEGHAEAQSDWMTEEYVPFKATLTFTPPYKTGDQDFMKNGSLILKKDNPSGLPEHDDAFEIPITFAPTQD